MNGQIDVFEVQDARLAQGKDGVALWLNTEVDDGFQVQIIAAKSLTITIGQDRQATLEDLLQLGAAYWHAFATRNREGYPPPGDASESR